jgi:hypothetical protein
MHSRKTSAAQAVANHKLPDLADSVVLVIKTTENKRHNENK